MTLVFALVLAIQQALVGDWTLNAGASDDINKAIDIAIADMNFIKRPIARRRLRGTNPPIAKVTIKVFGDSVEIVSPESVLRVRPDGIPMKWRYKGEVLAVLTTFEEGVLTNTFVAEDGERRNTYRLRPDGMLEQHVRLSSPQLKRPVEYRRVFTRD